MTFEDWLEEKLDAARRGADESQRIAPASWGAAYDGGYYDALQSIFADLPREIAQAQWPQDTIGASND